jgi:WD40 repeat protein/DNA-binding XRE family transcriptional regulator
MSQPAYPEHDYPFGLQILALRTECNLTQSRLAELLGISRQAVVGWEAGTSYPSSGHLKHLIELCLQYRAFHRGQEGEEIRLLWESARQRVPLDETWLAQLLEKSPKAPTAPTQHPHVDWGDAPEVSHLYGREPELAVLTEWLLAQHCRVVSLLGMGGIGKTSLAAKLAQEVAPRFERVYWRSLRDATLPGEWLEGAIRFLSDQQVVPPAAESERLVALLGLLRTRRCLLVLDNLETLFEPGQAEARYRAGLAGYGRLLQAIGEASHQSCLVLTSREAPAELAVLGSETVRIFPLGGLGADEARRVLAPKQLVGNNEQWVELTGRFGGNGLALRLVGERIRELFGGEIGLYLEEEGASSVFGGIRQLLDEQVGRSSAAEQQVLQALAAAREPLRLPDLLSTLGESLGRGAVLEAVEALRRRSLVERFEAGVFTLQSVVLEYMTERLVEEASEEISSGQPVLLVGQALIQSQTWDYVRHSQERLIGASILERLKADLGQEGTQQRLLSLLEGWRGRPAVEQGYGPGNVVNLLRLLRGDLRGLDLSRLELRQAYLAGVDAQDTSLAGAHLVETVLAEAFDFPGSVALGDDGAWLAAGTSNGEVWLWRVADRTPLWTVKGHTGGVWSLAVSADGRLVASGGGDGIVRLWEAESGRPLVTLEGHTGGVWTLAVSADGRLVASGSGDGIVRLWDTNAGQPLAMPEGHAGGVWGLGLSADGHLLVSGGGDGMVRLWDTSAERPLATLESHADGVRALALSADGRLVASGGYDGTVRLWLLAPSSAGEAPSGRLLATLQGHTGAVRGLAISADGRLVASGGYDGTVRLWLLTPSSAGEMPSGRLWATLQGHTGGIAGVAVSVGGRLVASGSVDGAVRLWDTRAGRLLATLQGQTGGVSGMAFSADGRLVASGGFDARVRLWDTSAGRLLATLTEHTGVVWTVALSADGHLLASGGLDGMVRLWDTSAGRLLATLTGHTGVVRSVAILADGRLVASGGFDGTVRLWDTSAGRLLATLTGHTGVVWAVALSADGRWLASGGADGTVRLWDTSAGHLLATFTEHTGVVWAVALSADGRWLASGGADGTVRLWLLAPSSSRESDSERPLARFEGHTGVVPGVALSADGQLLASSGFDGTVRLWDTSAGRLLATFEGHTGAVSGVGLSADGRLVASGGYDGTIRLWLLAPSSAGEAQHGACLRTLRSDRRYERLDITGLAGITDTQRAALPALGAIEKHEPPGAIVRPTPGARLTDDPRARAV